MDREEMLAKLEEFGLSRDALKDAPDPALAEMIRYCDTAQNPDETDETEDHEEQEHDLLGQVDEQPRDGETPARKIDEALQTTIHAEKDEDFKLPDPANEDERKKMEAFAARHLARAQKMMAKYREQDPGTTSMRPGSAGHADYETSATRDQDNAPPAGGRQPKSVTMSAKYAEQVKNIVRSEIRSALQQEVGKNIEELQKFREDVKANEKREAVDAIMAELVKDGKVPPAEVAMFSEILRDADRVTVVQKFSEKGKQISLTRFDQIVRQLRGRPTKFAERFRDPVAAGGNGRTDAKAWAEATYEKFSEAFRKTGATVTRAEFVKQAEDAAERGRGEFEKLQRHWDGLPATAV